MSDDVERRADADTGCVKGMLDRLRIEREAGDPFSSDEEKCLLADEVRRIEKQIAGLPEALHDNVAGADLLFSLKRRLKELEGRA